MIESANDIKDSKTRRQVHRDVLEFCKAETRRRNPTMGDFTVFATAGTLYLKWCFKGAKLRQEHPDSAQSILAAEFPEPSLTVIKGGKE